MIITDNKTLKLVSDYFRDAVSITGSGEVKCVQCSTEMSAAINSKFVNGWVRRFRKGLREGGAVGLPYRSERKIDCPVCGKPNNVKIPQNAMSALHGWVKECDPHFLYAETKSKLPALSAAKQKRAAAVNESYAVMSQRPYFTMPRPHETMAGFFAGLFSKKRKAELQDELAAKIQEYDSALAAHEVREAEWDKARAAAHTKEERSTEELNMAKDTVHYECKKHGILEMVFPEFVRKCEIAIDRHIAERIAETSPTRATRALAKKENRLRGAAGMSIGPSGLRPWVRVGGVGVSFGKSGMGFFARKGPFSLYMKNGKMRVGGRMFRF